MKQFTIRLLSLVTVVVMLATLLASCKGNDDPAEKSTAVTFLKDGATAYTILYAGDSDPINTGMSAAAIELSNAIKSTTGVEVAVQSDQDADEAATSGKEILIGHTNRSESQDVLSKLRADDYLIAVSGDKLVIGGGSADKNREAVLKFIQLYFSQTQTSLVLASDYRYEKFATYPVTSITLGGRELSEYSIVYSKDCASIANLLSDRLHEVYGYVLPVTAESTEERECEILVGKTARSQSALSVEDGCYRLKQEGSKLVLTGSDVSAVGCGVYDFVESLKDATVQLDGLDRSGRFNSSASVKIYDLNVALSGYAETAVVNRYPRLYRQVNDCSPDVLCLQEVSGTTWYDCLTKGIGDTPALVGDRYAFIGTPRNGSDPVYSAGLTGAYNAILYDQTKYKLEDSGTFWLSATPSTPSIGWDGRYRSTCTWVKLTELASGKTFAVMNTQLDSLGSRAQQNGVALLCERAAEFDCPVILCGDLQGNSTSRAYKRAINGGLLDASTIAKSVDGLGGTVNNFGTSEEESRATDFIFTAIGNSEVKSYLVIREKVDDGYVSSHWAILSEIGI